MTVSYLDTMAHIKAFVFDVDGVLTNGHVILLPDGQQMRHMHSKDGYAIQLAVKKGYHVAIITGGNSIQVKERLQNLGVTDIYLSASRKDDAMKDFCHSNGLQMESIAYMGDDIPDLSALHLVGLPCCPANAAPEVREMALFQSHLNGGDGCARDLIEKVMRIQGTWLASGATHDTFAEFTW